MSNLLAYEGNSLLHESLVRKILNLSNNLKVKTLKEKRSIFAISCFEDSPLKGDRIFENENWIVLFAGRRGDDVDGKNGGGQSFGK